MVSPCLLSCLLLLPWGTCFPLLGREKPMDAMGGIEGEVSWAGGRQVHFPWGSSQQPRVPHPHALLGTAVELRMSGREHTGVRFGLGGRMMATRLPASLWLMARLVAHWGPWLRSSMATAGRKVALASTLAGGEGPGHPGEVSPWIPSPHPNFHSTSLKDAEKMWLLL